MEAIIEKLNLSKIDKAYYTAKRTPALIDLDAYYYLSHEGVGSPNDAAFGQAIERLYAVAYGVKFLCKAEDMDFTVPKMEGQWWIAGGPEVQHLFTQTLESDWHWKIMIRQPDFVEAHHFYRAVQLARKKQPGLVEDEVKFELQKGGRCVQMLHGGSYHEEQPTIAQIMSFIQENGLSLNQYHKEIYLNDPRKTPEPKLRTIIRYGVE